VHRALKREEDAIAEWRTGRPGRSFYRLRVHRRRKGERQSLSEAGYAHLVSAAHQGAGRPDDPYLGRA
jgi:hypothetical protein